ncbi:hypothetical protein PXK58_08890 [Phaeobacter gallaeciensis]|uniref:hypothetical protein n=1 Tax=Phaeobacter gallaeciensis TaxID=60890 RepID=UPI00238099BA|nr:hypothetical protein [Phaeobacter gallaeciensis]MDE4274759.1 hypothetical protein [Phaeobacter gallaeciensis]MDE4299667.1 hypothetical protein [Phaeobacter gallaeciensis]MDE5184832.1 hypothetical protein [Phaeobacter gallaeciensis]
MENPDLQLGVEFFKKAVLNPRKTKAEGRPIYDDREYVRIAFPADNKRKLEAPAHEKHYNANAQTQMTYAERFSQVYAAFKEDTDMSAAHGTPLFEMTALTEAKRAELRGMGVKTVEQLAGLPDASMKRLGMGARDLVESAKAFIDAAKGTAEVQALKDKIAHLEALMSGGATEQEPQRDIADEFEGMTDDDLKNLIRDSGGDVPRGNAKRETLVEVLRELAAKADKAA